MVFLARQGLAHQSIMAYLSGVRNLAIANGDTSVDRDQMPCLQLVLRGVARSPSHQGGTCPRLPITGAIMHQLLGVWSGDGFESWLMWAATCVGYFGFMRVGEFTAVGTAPPPQHSVAEVAINLKSAPTVVCLWLHRAKTDPFGRGVEIFLGVSGMAVCPVAALMRYLYFTSGAHEERQGRSVKHPRK